jgi:hypothetical protein
MGVFAVWGANTLPQVQKVVNANWRLSRVSSPRVAFTNLREGLPPNTAVPNPTEDRALDCHLDPGVP